VKDFLQRLLDTHKDLRRPFPRQMERPRVLLQESLMLVIQAHDTYRGYSRVLRFWNRQQLKADAVRAKQKVQNALLLYQVRATSAYLLDGHTILKS
jgi:hypothetical protein